MSTAPGQLTHRHVALLRAVAAGRVELTVSCVPDLYVDGLCCCDHAAGSILTAAGFIRATGAAAVGKRLPADLTDAGRWFLDHTTPAA